MRWLLLAGLAVAACSAAKPQPPLPLPVGVPGTVQIGARAVGPVGDLYVVEVALTSEHPQALTLDPRQVFARVADPTGGSQQSRVAQLTPAEAARRAGGESLPGVAARGVAEGGLRGAATGAVTGGGTGSAVGAAVGAIGGIFRAAQDQPPDVASFTDHALPQMELRTGMSATGLVYFPVGEYTGLEVVLAGEPDVVRVLLPIAPAPPED